MHTQRTFVKSICIGLLSALAFLGAPVPPAHATTFTVNSTTDAVDATPGDGVCATAGAVCTLRAAIQEANALAGDDTITVPAGTFTLTITGTGEDEAATGDLDITSNITINGAGAGSTIIDGGALDRVFHVIGAFTVNISGVTVRNGNTTGDGGGIATGGTLTISNSTFSSNSAGGGGIANGGTLTITNSTFSSNSASGSGGGIFITSLDTTTISNSTFSSNSASGGGGGIVTFFNGTTTVTNSTFSGNSGIGIRRVSGTVTLLNTIVANSTSGGNCSGTITDGGNNLDSANTCGFTTNAKINTDPNLGSLTGNPAYFPLNSGSAAIDAGTNTGCPTTSQNGVTCPVDGDNDATATRDIGSFERVFGTTAVTLSSFTACANESPLRMEIALAVGGVFLLGGGLALRRARKERALKSH